jgi:hypothetical protein
VPYNNTFRWKLLHGLGSFGASGENLAEHAPS